MFFTGMASKRYFCCTPDAYCQTNCATTKLWFPLPVLSRSTLNRFRTKVRTACC